MGMHVATSKNYCNSILKYLNIIICSSRSRCVYLITVEVEEIYWVIMINDIECFSKLPLIS